MNVTIVDQITLEFHIPLCVIWIWIYLYVIELRHDIKVLFNVQNMYTDKL